MDNMTGAIRMAGGIILAVLLASLIMFMYERLKVYPALRAQQKLEEEVADFNTQFRAYEKSQMYGTDVISCLNLAYEYNRTNRNYGNTRSYISRNSEGVSSDIVEVEVNLASGSPLVTNTKVYAMDREVNQEVEVYKTTAQKFTFSRDDTLNTLLRDMNKEELLNNIGLGLGGRITIENIAKNPINKTETINTLSITKSQGNSDNNYIRIKSLIENPTVTIENGKFDIYKNQWTRVILNTAGSDLKGRIFRWKNTEYNENGRIKKIIFEEIKK